MIRPLSGSTCPMILLGAGARESAKKIINYAEHFRIPMETTWNAIDLVPYDHPLFVGRPGIVATRGSNRAIQACDLLLALGARLDQPTIAYDYDNFAPKANKIVVDIDKGELLKLPVGWARYVQQDAGEFISGLDTYNSQLSSSKWLEQCSLWKQDRLEGITATYQLMDFLSDTLPEEAILVINSGCMAVNIFCAGFRNRKGQRFIQTSSGLGSMGAAIPTAIGVAIASGRPVTVVDGDGSFMQNIQELEVVRRMNLPITFYVINNNGYASIRCSELRSFGRTKGGETIPDLNKLAEAFGIHINNVVAEEDELPIPRVMFDGRGCLEDMFPYDQ